MKLHQLVTLTEDADPTALFSEIKQRCAMNVPMYRGANPGPTVIHKQVRQDRRPLNAASLSTVMFNYAIEEAFKIPSIRQRCTFASSSKSTASSYGEGVYCIFPPSDAMVVYDERVMDSGDVLDDIDYELTQEIGMPRASLAAVEGMSILDTKAYLEKFMGAMDQYKKPEFKEWLDWKLPTYIEGYKSVQASALRSVGSNVELMIVSPDIYGVDATYANEHGGGGTDSPYERAVQLIQAAQ